MAPVWALSASTKSNSVSSGDFFQALATSASVFSFPLFQIRILHGGDQHAGGTAAIVIEILPVKMIASEIFLYASAHFGLF